MIAFSREYKKKLMDDSEITCFMTITDKMVYQWDLSKGYEERTPFTHGFPKLPVLYAYRPEPYCKKIKTFRVRLEKLLSNYADCIFFRSKFIHFGNAVKSPQITRAIFVRFLSVLLQFTSFFFPSLLLSYLYTTSLVQKGPLDVCLLYTSPSPRD